MPAARPPASARAAARGASGAGPRAPRQGRPDCRGSAAKTMLPREGSGQGQAETRLHHVHSLFKDLNDPDGRMLDYHLFRSANDLAARHDGCEDVIKAYVQASELIFAVGVIALFLFFGPRLRRAAVAAGLTAGLALLVAHFLAAAIDRNRPFVDHPKAHLLLAHSKDPGFPSDHATGAFAIAFALVLRDRASGLVALVLALALSFGRVALGVHYPSDVF